METRLYSLEEISKNDGKGENRTWIIIKDSVYDVTDFVEEHPGGSDLILEWAGKNATRAFEDVGHSSDAKRELKQLKIGEVREEDRKQKQQSNKTERKTDKGNDGESGCCTII